MFSVYNQSTSASPHILVPTFVARKKCQKNNNNCTDSETRLLKLQQKYAGNEMPIAVENRMRLHNYYTTSVNFVIAICLASFYCLSKIKNTNNATTTPQPQTKR